MKLFRKVIDERQELEMMRVERSSFWVMFVGLAVVITAQVFAFNFDFEHIAGESVVLIIGVAWALIGYIRRGSWDYFTKPGMKSYVLYSIAAAVIFGTFAPLKRYLRDGASLTDSLLLFAINFVFLFILVFVSLFLVGTITKKRQNKLQQEYMDEK